MGRVLLFIVAFICTYPFVDTVALGNESKEETSLAPDLTSNPQSTVSIQETRSDQSLLDDVNNAIKTLNPQGPPCDLLPSGEQPSPSDQDIEQINRAVAEVNLLLKTRGKLPTPFVMTPALEMYFKNLRRDSILSGEWVCPKAPCSYALINGKLYLFPDKSELAKGAATTTSLAINIDDRKILARLDVLNNQKSFKREAEILEKVQGPGIVEPFQFFANRNGISALQELYPEELGHSIEDGALQTWSNSEKIGAVRDLMASLQRIHHLKLVHSDIKPANILIAGKPGERQAFLSDFDLTTEEGMNSRGGTIDYMLEGIYFKSKDDEVVTNGAHRAAKRDDIFALGKVIYELGAGKVSKMYPHKLPAFQKRKDANSLDELYELDCTKLSEATTLNRLEDKLRHLGCMMMLGKLSLDEAELLIKNMNPRAD